MSSASDNISVPGLRAGESKPLQVVSHAAQTYEQRQEVCKPFTSQAATPPGEENPALDAAMQPPVHGGITAEEVVDLMLQRSER